MFKKILILSIVIMLSACGRINIHNFKAHNEENINPAKVSILHATRYHYVHEIDGKGRYSPEFVNDVFPYTGAVIELLPGKHTLSIEYHSSRVITKGTIDISFNFLPGKQYFLYSKKNYTTDDFNQVTTYVKYQISECGSKDEKEFNERESKHDYLFNPFVPACGVLEPVKK